VASYLVLDEAELGIEVYPGQVWWGPFYFSGGFVDATSYFSVPIALSYVESAISFYPRGGGGYVKTSGWYRHVAPFRQGATVARRWRGYLPSTAAYSIAWWKGGGVYTSPSKWFR